MLVNLFVLFFYFKKTVKTIDLYIVGRKLGVYYGISLGNWFLGVIEYKKSIKNERKQ